MVAGAYKLPVGTVASCICASRPNTAFSLTAGMNVDMFSPTVMKSAVSHCSSGAIRSTEMLKLQRRNQE